jgi:hypothetical protein
MRILEQITDLPNALGKHACECGHPEMPRLPDGVYRCPTCGLEVVSLESVAAQTGPEGNSHKCKEKTPWPTNR